MEPLLNQLLEQAANLAAQLTHELDEAGGAIDILVERAGMLADRLATEGDEAHQHFSQLAAALEQAEGELETAAGNAGSSLDALEGRAATVQSQVQELLRKVKAGTNELEDLKGRLAHDLQHGMETAETDFQQLTERIQQIETDTDQRLQEASTLIATFRQAVDEARQEFAEGKGRLLQALERLEYAARDQTEAFTHGVDAALAESAQALVNMGNQMLNAHNDAVLALHQKFVEESRGWATEALEPLRLAVEDLNRASVVHDESLAERIGPVRQKIESAMQIMERCQAVLDMAAALG